MTLLQIAQVLSRSRISASQCVALILAQSESTIGDLARACQTSEASASSSVKTLARKGWVTTLRNGKDARKVYVKISHEGSKALQKLNLSVNQ